MLKFIDVDKFVHANQSNVIVGTNHYNTLLLHCMYARLILILCFLDKNLTRLSRRIRGHASWCASILFPLRHARRRKCHRKGRIDDARRKWRSFPCKLKISIVGYATTSNPSNRRFKFPKWQKVGIVNQPSNTPRL